MQRFFKHDTKGNIRRKVDKLEYIKFNNFCSFEDARIMKREATEWENLFFNNYYTEYIENYKTIQKRGTRNV